MLILYIVVLICILAFLFARRRICVLGLVAMYKKKKVSIYYCDTCGQEFGTIKPTGKCKHDVCGSCVHYCTRGFCEHRKTTDFCADRDSDAICNIDSFKSKS